MIATGAIPPRRPTAFIIKFLTPESSLLNCSSALVPNSIIGVTSFRNCSPSGIRDVLISSIAFWNLNIGESSTFFNSRSDRIANSSEVAFASPSTVAAWLPSFLTFWKSVDRRANWNLPNICSIARARFSGSRVSRASAMPRTIPFTSPLLASTMPLMLMPNPCINSLAFALGLIIEARPDLSALAPSDALMPPSFIAVRKNARSSTLPPSC